MAKASEGGIFERHVEKFVLIGCLLILIYAIVHWGLATPRSVEIVTERGIGSSQVEPGAADDQLVKASEAIAKRIDGEKIPPRQKVNYLSRFADFKNDPLAEAIPTMTALVTPGQALKAEDDAGLRKATLTLAQVIQAMPAPAKPQVQVVPTLPQKPEAQDVIVGHTIAVYPWAELQQAWGDLLGFRPDMVAARIDVEVRERQPDGSWSEPRPAQFIGPAPTDNANTPLKVPEVPAYNQVNTQQIQAAKQALAGWQQHILEPAYWNIWWPTQQWGSWTLNMPENPIAQEGQETPAGYGEPVPPAGTVVEPPPPPEYRDPRAAPRPMPSPVATPARPTEAGPRAKVVPAIEQQKASGRLLVWSHVGGLEANKTYQFRVRMVMVSPVLTFTADVQDPKDAAVPLVASAFSPWSESVSVPHTTEFFLTGSSQTLGTMGVTVFTRSMGQWVGFGFQVKEGETIGGPKEVKVTNPATGEATSVTVDFTTGAVAVKFNFDRTVPMGGIPKRTAELLYLDQQGTLHGRVRLIDEESQRFKQLSRDARGASR